MSLKTFQKENNLIADGILGKKTISKIKEVYSLNTLETTHFLAQLDHETGGFKHSRENLNYSADRLLVIFRKYFKTYEQAKEYHRNPEKIANKVYANRMGNRDEKSGDGYKYSGKGAIQLTGFNNYKSFSEYKNDPEILTNPDIVATKYYFEAAIWFFRKRGLFKLCVNTNYNTVKLITRKINGGYNGLEHRYLTTKKYFKILKEIERDEQNNKNTNNSSTDSNRNNLDREQLEEQTDKEGKPTSEGGNTKKRFIAPFIQWFIDKFV